MTDLLTDGQTRHWTGVPRPIAGFVRIDGRSYRFMGDDPDTVPALHRVSLRVTSTYTIHLENRQFANSERFSGNDVFFSSVGEKIILRK